MRAIGYMREDYAGRGGGEMSSSGASSMIGLHLPQKARNVRSFCMVRFDVRCVLCVVDSRVCV